VLHHNVTKRDLTEVEGHRVGRQRFQSDAEARALRAVFGDHTDRIVVTSTKGVTGHTLGAAGALEAVFAIQALREGVVPPTANLTEQDPEIHLDVVRDGPREVAMDAVLTTSMGFGGQNAALVFTRA
jgi:3-oxoacyl-[acyl-carrier-protein] synthase II